MSESEKGNEKAEENKEKRAGEEVLFASEMAAINLTGYHVVFVND